MLECWSGAIWGGKTQSRRGWRYRYSCHAYDLILNSGLPPCAAVQASRRWAGQARRYFYGANFTSSSKIRKKKQEKKREKETFGFIFVQITETYDTYNITTYHRTTIRSAVRGRYMSGVKRVSYVCITPRGGMTTEKRERGGRRAWTARQDRCGCIWLWCVLLPLCILVLVNIYRLEATASFEKQSKYDGTTRAREWSVVGRREKQTNEPPNTTRYVKKNKTAKLYRGGVRKMGK